MHDLWQRVQSCGAIPPPPQFNEDLALINPVYCPTSATYQKHLKLGKCLEIDNRRSLSKFGDIACLIRILQTVLYFTDRILKTVL